MIKKGFTLIEMLVAVTLFSVVGLIVVQTFYTTFNFQQRTSLEVSLIEDANFIMNSLAREIQSGRIDYDEYFSQCVISGVCPLAGVDMEAAAPGDLGENHGAYGWQFFDGGYKTAAKDPMDRDSVGLLCQKADGTLLRYPDDECVSSSLSFSEDENIGVFGGTASSAVCSAEYYPYESRDPGLSYDPVSGNGACLATQGNVFQELYLISDDGNRKVVIGREKISNEGAGSYVVSKLSLVSQSLDQTNAQLAKSFKCDSGFDCSLDGTGSGEDKAYRQDLYEYVDGEDVLKDFIPISPTQVSVKSLFFVVDPLEDPERAFNEFSESTQRAASVTIILELEKSPKYPLPFLSESYNLTLQRTILANVGV